MLWWKNKVKSAKAQIVLLTYLVVPLFAPFYLFSQSPPPLSEGDWYKIGVITDGIYKLDADYLRSLGINTNQLIPEQIALFSNGSGILPQANSSFRPDNLLPVATWVDPKSDGHFDVVYFYAEGPASIRFDSLSKRYQHEVNPYTDTTYYFLNIRNATGLKIQTQSQSIPDSPVFFTTFDHYWFYEKESVNLLKSGREWWGDYLGTNTSRSFELEIPGLVTSAPGILSFGAIASAQAQTRFLWQVNDQSIGEQTVGTVSTYRYDLKARKTGANFIFTTPGEAQEKLKMNIAYDKKNQSAASAYLDYVSIQIKRHLAQYPTPTLYRFPSVSDNNRVFEFSTISDDFVVWDISDPLRPLHMDPARTTSGTFLIAPQGQEPHTYIGFKKTQAIIPHSFRKIANQNIRAETVPDMIIVTADTWRNEAIRLADFRQTHDNLDVLVVTMDQVFNEFSSGKQDVTAIRDLCRYFYLREKGRLKYLLLFGDATYDFRNRTGTSSPSQQHAWIPSYQSRESLHPVYTFSSDDYFGFLEDDAGNWEESSEGDHLLQIGVGRLPVKNKEEARLVVDKLIDYTSSSNIGKWRNNITFIADNGDNNIHQQHADMLAREVTNNFTPSRVFIDEYPLTQTSLGNRSPQIKNEIQRRINEGSLIVNFTGHGDESGWTDEQILTLSDIQSLRGYRNMPLLVTATCEFGRYDDPAIVSGAELMLLSPRGAAIAAMTTTRPVFASTNFSINSAFYKALTAGNHRLGDLTRITKNNSLAGSLNRNFVLLGDPSMRLAIPEKGVRWASSPDTLTPLEKATLKGEIYDQTTGNKSSDFNGLVYISVYDKPTRFDTRGAISPPASYEEHRTKLFEGTATVTEGQFEFSFVVPNQGFTDFREGLTRIYAHTNDEIHDASGHLSITLGAPSRLPPTDSSPPEATAFLNDASFLDGQTVPPAPILYVSIKEEGGLKIYDETGNCGITAILNDTLSLPIADYYSANRDSYSEGTITMPLNHLQEGDHSLKLRFCDVSGNTTEKTIRFKIGKANSIAITSPLIFPNPFRDKISYRFEHNRPGTDLEVELKLFSLTGRKVYSHTRRYYDAPKTLESDISPVFFVGEIKPEPQIYLYELTLRSLQDMSIQSTTGKLLHR